MFFCTLFLGTVASSSITSKKEVLMGCVKMKVSTAEPCQICGKPDWCFRLAFDGDSNVLHCCARSTEKYVGSYILIKTKDTDIGQYGYYEEIEKYEEFLEKNKKSPKKTQHKKAAQPMKPAEKSSVLISGEVAVKDPVFLDAVYRRFLSLLCLEPWHEERLKKDWDTDSTGELFSRIVQTFPIKSLPPADWFRSATDYSDGHKNLTRYKICQILANEFGSLAGVPGFYESKGNWNFTGTEGILFPVYDRNGRIIRLRIRDDYPDISGNYNGVDGTFCHSYSKQGTHAWKFVVKETRDVVDLPDQKMLVCPPGKAGNKYKNFTSVFEKTGKKADGTRFVYNGYEKNGSRSGSNISLYCKPGDNFSTVYVTEGEKKAIVANMLLGVPVISLPGTGTFSKLFEKDSSGKSMMDYLSEKGMKLCVICYDADKNENVRVLQSEQKAVQEFLKRGLHIAIGEWNPNWGKGLDDTLVLGIRPRIYHVT